MNNTNMGLRCLHTSVLAIIAATQNCGCLACVYVYTAHVSDAHEDQKMEQLGEGKPRAGAGLEV